MWTRLFQVYKDRVGSHYKDLVGYEKCERNLILYSKIKPLRGKAVFKFVREPFAKEPNVGWPIRNLLYMGMGNQKQSFERRCLLGIVYYEVVDSLLF